LFTNYGAFPIKRGPDCKSLFPENHRCRATWPGERFFELEYGGPSSAKSQVTRRAIVVVLWTNTHEWPPKGVFEKDLRHFLSRHCRCQSEPVYRMLLLPPATFSHALDIKDIGLWSYKTKVQVTDIWEVGRNSFSNSR